MKKANVQGRGVPSVEELTQEFQVQIAKAARAQFTNEELVDAWIAAGEGEVTLSAVKAWRQNGNHLLEYLALHKLHVLSITRVEAQAFARWVETAPYRGRQKEGPLKPGSVLQHIIAGSGLFNYLRDVRGFAIPNPFFPLIRGFKKRHRGQLHPDLRAVDERETLLLLDGCEGLDDFTLVLLLFKTGIRRQEATTIRMEDIDWKQRVINLAPHPRRTYLKAYFDAELEWFLRLKCEENKRTRPGNPWLWPSHYGKNRHVDMSFVNSTIQRIARAGPLAATIHGTETGITPHTFRRAFTSVLKRKRPTAPAGCPSHVVAVLRGDSLLSRNENTPDTTQGHYTKFSTVEGVPELRYWYDRCMPQVGAREAWDRLMVHRAKAANVAGLIRAVKNGAR